MRVTFARGRRLAIALNVGVVVLLALALWAGANVLATRPAVKRVFDFSPHQRFSLSEATEKLLARLRENPELEVQIHTFYEFVPRDVDPAQTNQRLLELTTDLVKQYANLGGDRIRVVHHSIADQFEARETFTKLGVTPQSNVVVVNLGKRSRVLGIWRDLGDVDFPGGMGDPPPGAAARLPVLKGYKGEEAITSAIQSLLEEGNVTAYVVADQETLSSTGVLGLGHLKGDLGGIGIDVRPLNLKIASVPADAAAVAVLDPALDLGPDEIVALNAYLDRGGKLVLSSSFVEGGGEDTFGELAVRLGIRYSQKMLCAGVPDPANPTKLRFGTPYCRFIRIKEMSPQHPVTRELVGRSFPLVKYCRAISVREAPDVTAEPLLRTDTSGFEESIGPATDWMPDGGKTSPYPAGVAVTSKDAQKPFKAVVLTGYPMINENFGQNREFVLSAFRWLTDRTHLVSVPTKRYAAARLELSDPQIYRIRWLLVVFLPGALALAGIVVLWFRRR